MRALVGLLLCLAAVLLAACNRHVSAPPVAPPAVVVDALQRGINLGMWSADGNLDSVHAAQVHPDDADLKLIRKLGFRHVRVSFDPAWLADEHWQIRPARLSELRGDLQRLADHQLFVLLSMQPDSSVKKRLAGDRKLLTDSAALWKTLGGELSAFKPGQLAYELLNEPELADPQQLRRVLETYAAALRQSAPGHTLVVQGTRYGDLDDLLKMQPLGDRNIVYSFHFYEPKNFTHQGVPYGWPMWGLLRDLPYPSTPENVAPALAFLPVEAIEHVRWYGEQRWDRAKLAALIKQGRDWSRQHNVPLLCSEFGVYRYTVKPEYRLAWLRDVRELLQDAGIGWTLWDYSGYFGIVSGPQGQRILDHEAANALALTPPAGNQ